MPPLRKPNSISELVFALENVNDRLKARDDLDAERRRQDDLRRTTETKEREQLLARTGKLEGQWNAFFGEFGAFQGVITTVKDHGKKLDRLMWIAAVGVGIMTAVDVLLRWKS